MKQHVKLLLGLGGVAIFAIAWLLSTAGHIPFWNTADMAVADDGFKKLCRHDSANGKTVTIGGSSFENDDIISVALRTDAGDQSVVAVKFSKDAAERLRLESEAHLGKPMLVKFGDHVISKPFVHETISTQEGIFAVSFPEDVDSQLALQIAPPCR